MSKKLLKTETRMSRDQAAEKMRDLADKISEGNVELKAGNDSVSLEPADEVEFELQVEEEADGEMSIEVEIEWNPENENKEVEIG